MATITLNRSAALVGGLVLLGLGAAGAYMWNRGLQHDAGSQATTPVMSTTETAPTMPRPASPPGSDVVITLTEEAARRAGIEVATVTTSNVVTALRIPGLVQPNAYKAVTVTPIVSGRVSRVAAELGQTVRPKQLLAEIYSPDLVEARTKYLAAQAELGAHELELQRTEKLVAIGAASRQELEHIHAEHAAALAMLESYRARLSLLGVTDEDMRDSTASPTLRVTAPASGVITARQANEGLNVDPSTPLFTVADLSSVWVVGELYERDFAVVKVGDAAVVSFAAYPDLRVNGSVTYIDPQIKNETRTAQVRVQVPNPKGQFRLGMLAEVQLRDARHGEALTVPRSAVQTVGELSVVYVVTPSDPTHFRERTVTLGNATASDIQILSGVKAGETVVSKGSFSLRAERERLGLTSSSAGTTSARPPAPSQQPAQTARITVTDQGYEPARVSFKANAPARLTFVRVSDKTCGTEVVIPNLSIKRSLPLNQAVDIDFTPTKTGPVEFVCGMNMLKGTIVVE